MDIVGLLITVILWGIIFYVLYWGLDKLALKEPFNKVAFALLILATVVVLLGVLFGSIPYFRFGRL